MKATLIIIILVFANQLYAQDTVRLNDKTFYRISTTALGKAIVYSQRNVQLKQKGKFIAVKKEGEARFSLNKNFYIDGNSTYKDRKGEQNFVRYINGTEVYSEQIYGNHKRVEWVDVEQKDNDYFITKYLVSQPDSSIEKYKNKTLILKEKYRNGKLIMQNDLIKKTVFLYDNYGNLNEKHYGNIEEKYTSNGTVYFKKVFLKNRTEEYKNGIINKVLEFKVNSDKQDVVVITNYDEKGNATDSTETAPWSEVAPEYMQFDLEPTTLESYKSTLQKKQAKR